MVFTALATALAGGATAAGTGAAAAGGTSALMSALTAATTTGVSTGTVAGTGSALTSALTAATGVGTGVGTGAAAVGGGGLLAGIGKAAAIGAGTGAVQGAGTAAIQGGNIEDIIKGGATGAIEGAATGAITSGIGGAIEQVTKGSNKLSSLVQKGDDLGLLNKSQSTAAAPTPASQSVGAATQATTPVSQGVGAATQATTPDLRPKVNVSAVEKVGVKHPIAAKGIKTAGKVASQYGVQGALSVMSGVQASKQADAANQVSQQSLLFQQQTYREARNKEEQTKAQLKADALTYKQSLLSFGEDLYNANPSSTNLLTGSYSTDGTGNQGIYSILNTGVTTSKRNTEYIT